MQRTLSTQAQACIGQDLVSMATALWERLSEHNDELISKLLLMAKIYDALFYYYLLRGELEPDKKRLYRGGPLSKWMERKWGGNWMCVRSR
ncbi:hypothetical protein Q7C36_001822 [Tachysurus vachellii]|uniref:Uncharacterized protein n=1 Tax=Tachysurus vachellii TaxID=175792 RepID=A0AA88NTJ4_TACVA|nr:hypothetical protein Q7C36_001822 [Tachysurus vachellii]